MDSEYRFQYWDSLGSVRVGTGTTVAKDAVPAIKEIPLHLGFNPASQYPSLFGVGWSFPIFESRLEWRDDSTVELFLPDGNTGKLTRTGKNAKALKGSGWLGEVAGRQVTCKASCGWVLIFKDNRLASMKTPEGTMLDIVVDSDRSRSLVSGGRALVTLKPDFDPVTTRKVYHLKFANDSALLKMGQRPVLVKTKGKPDRLATADSLVSVDFQGKPNEGKMYDFKKPDELKMREGLHKWDSQTYRLLKKGEEEYDVLNIRGITCLRTRYLNVGLSELHGRWGDLHINQRGDGPVVLSEYFYTARSIDLKKAVQLLPSGEEVVIRQLWIDENGMPIRLLTRGDNGKEIIQIFEDSKITVMDNSTKAVLWTGQYDKDGRMISCKTTKGEYQFKHDDAAKNVQITRSGSALKRELPKEAFANVFALSIHKVHLFSQKH
jgi:hypothetical protein